MTSLNEKSQRNKQSSGKRCISREKKWNKIVLTMKFKHSLNRDSWLESHHQMDMKNGAKTSGLIGERKKAEEKNNSEIYSMKLLIENKTFISKYRLTQSL